MRQLKITKQVTNRETASLDKYLQEIGKVDYFIKRNTLEKFGPVRTVKAELVFEIGFEGINASTRHKSGIAVRFPRILRWRIDKSVKEADTIETLRLLLSQFE